MTELKKYWIRGNAKHGTEVIKMLEDLGGKNEYGLFGAEEECIYYINICGEIVQEYAKSKFASIIGFIGEELTLPEKKPDPKPENNLKWGDHVMVSHNGEEWNFATYENDRKAYVSANVGTMVFKYIVPFADFDPNDLEGNIKKSVI